MTVTTRSAARQDPAAAGAETVGVRPTVKQEETVSLAATDSCSSSGSDTDDADEHLPFAGTKTTATTTTVRRRRRTKEEEEVSMLHNTEHAGAAALLPQNATPAPPYTFVRWCEVMVGSLIFFGTLPFVVVQIVSCTLWELLDQQTLNVTGLATRFNTYADPYLAPWTHHPKDGFMVTTTLWLGVVLPAYFFYEAYTQATSLAAGQGFLWYRAALYNMIRIGPMYRHFMYVYVLCHKEAHSYGKLFKEPYNTRCGLSKVYNYFIGFFHGVLPGPFTESHIYNHHKYDNAVEDVYSTGAFPRDSFLEYLRYVYVWFLYALNLSSMKQFYTEGKFDRMGRCLGGSLYYGLGVTLAWHLVGKDFALVYIVYPLIEGNILLSAVNYTWHAFIDPHDHENDYVNSVTILDGLNFTLEEEYHVVHHQVRN